MIEVKDSTFDEEVLKSDIPVVVDFWAPWCKPCNAIAPLIEDLELKYKNKVKFVKMNVDDYPVTPGSYMVRSIPTLLFIKNSHLQEHVVGLMTKNKIEEYISKIYNE